MKYKFFYARKPVELIGDEAVVETAEKENKERLSESEVGLPKDFSDVNKEDHMAKILTSSN